MVAFGVPKTFDCSENTSEPHHAEGEGDVAYCRWYLPIIPSIMIALVSVGMVTEAFNQSEISVLVNLKGVSKPADADSKLI